jgi:hypothetical protein
MGWIKVASSPVFDIEELEEYEIIDHPYDQKPNCVHWSKVFFELSYDTISSIMRNTTCS